MSTSIAANDLNLDTDALYEGYTASGKLPEHSDEGHDCPADQQIDFVSWPHLPAGNGTLT